MRLLAMPAVQFDTAGRRSGARLAGVVARPALLVLRLAATAHGSRVPLLAVRAPARLTAHRIPDWFSSTRGARILGFRIPGAELRGGTSHCHPHAHAPGPRTSSLSALRYAPNSVATHYVVTQCAFVLKRSKGLQDGCRIDASYRLDNLIDRDVHAFSVKVRTSGAEEEHHQIV